MIYSGLCPAWKRMCILILILSSVNNLAHWFIIPLHTKLKQHTRNLEATQNLCHNLLYITLQLFLHVLCCRFGFSIVVHLLYCKLWQTTKLLQQQSNIMLSDKFYSKKCLLVKALVIPISFTNFPILLQTFLYSK